MEGEPRYPYLSRDKKDWVYDAHGIPKEDRKEYNIHHIIPAMYAIAFLGMPPELVNAPENLFPLLIEEHIAIHKPPHEIGNWRETGEPYHYTHRDDELKQGAAEAAQAYRAQGNIYPGERRV